MAMTKKEIAAVDAIKRELAEERAFGWPREAEPQQVDIAAFKEANPGVLFQGYTFNTYRIFNRHGGDPVMHGCANTGHAITELYNPMPTKTTSQGVGGPWYRTEREARLAARWKACRQMAEMLADLDEKLNADAGY